METSKNILIISSGRSGSTWIYDLFWASGAFKTRLFEPFKNHQTQPFNSNLYLDPNDNQYVDSFRSFYHNARNVLIKEISINLRYPWVLQNIPEFTCLYLLRNPISVTYSQVTLRWFRKFDIAWYESIFCMFPEFKNYYKESFSYLEKVFYHWCLENCITLILVKDKPNFMFYELFCLEPESQIKTIFKQLDIPVNENVIKQILVPSSVSNGRLLKDRLQKDLVKKYEVSETDKSKCMDILKCFQAEDLYDWDTFLPNVSNIKNYYTKFDGQKT